MNNYQINHKKNVHNNSIDNLEIVEKPMYEVTDQNIPENDPEVQTCLKINTIVRYRYFHRTGHCRIQWVGDLSVNAIDIHTGKELVMSKDVAEFSPETIKDPKSKQHYEILDINYPEDDPEMVQVLFSHKDENVDPNEYVLNIIYDVAYEYHPGDPNCWSSDWDCLGYTECEAEVIDLQVHHHDHSQDTDHLVGIGKQVDEINIDAVMTRETWGSIRNSVESNYCDHMEAIAKEGYNE